MPKKHARPAPSTNIDAEQTEGTLENYARLWRVTIQALYNLDEAEKQVQERRENLEAYIRKCVLQNASHPNYAQAWLEQLQEHQGEFVYDSIRMGYERLKERVSVEADTPCAVPSKQGVSVEADTPCASPSKERVSVEADAPCAAPSKQEPCTAPCDQEPHTAPCDQEPCETPEAQDEGIQEPITIIPKSKNQRKKERKRAKRLLQEVK